MKNHYFYVIRCFPIGKVENNNFEHQILSFFNTDFIKSKSDTRQYCATCHFPLANSVSEKSFMFSVKLVKNTNLVR